MGESLPKQYLKLNGITVLEHTLGLILREPKINQAVVCLGENDDHWQILNVADERLQTTLGGATRAASVLNGILSFADQADDQDWLLVHDAARPCLSAQRLTYFLQQIDGDEVGGILALASNDTVKQAFFVEQLREEAKEGTSRIEKTLNRDLIWYAQTPQMFRYGLLKNALQVALDKKLDITDEASAIEQAGYQAKLIRGEAGNIKITNPEDLWLAEAMLARSQNSL